MVIRNVINILIKFYSYENTHENTYKWSYPCVCRELIKCTIQQNKRHNAIDLNGSKIAESSAVCMRDLGKIG